MKIEFLKLRNFRNYEKLEINFHNHVNVFIGHNGIGKSNLLEAIEYCLSGTSFRVVPNPLVIKRDSDHNSANISAIVDNKNIKKNINVLISENKKEIKINSKVVSSNVLKRHSSSIVFSPENLSIVKQGPQERRALIDEVAVSLEGQKAVILAGYVKCLKTRNRVLKNYAENNQSKAETLMLLESINPQFLQYASDLVFLRLKTINMMKPVIKQALFGILGEALVDITVDYVISGKTAIDWSQNQVYDALKMRLVELQDAELSSGQSLVGPHKHDVQFIYNGQNARTFCSQGQQRSIILAVKIAQIMKYAEIHGEYPVLLLDDVFSELDSVRRESLMKLLSESPAQIFLTMTELDNEIQFGSKEVKVFEMSRELIR